LEEVESKGKSILWVLTGLCGLILAVTVMRNPGDYDLWWHLRMGMDWLENGLSPWVDHYSFTYPGHEISSPPVAFQATLWQLTEWFGERGAQLIYKGLCFFGVLVLAVVWLRMIKAPILLSLIVLPLLVAALQIRVMVRPELFSYVLALAALILYHRANLRLEVRTMLPVVLLLLVWTVYHSPIFGYVIFFGLFIDIALRLIREKQGAREWARWAAWGGLAFVVGFANLEKDHAVLGMLSFAVEAPWEDYIAEYKPTLEGFRNVSLLGLVVPVLLLIVMFSGLLLSLLQKRLGHFVVLAVFTYAGLSMNRMFAPAAVISLMFFADLASSRSVWNTLRVAPANSQKALIAAVMLITAFLLFNDVRHARFYLSENRYSWAKVPEAMVDYLAKSELQGNVFNVYQMGGYFLYRLSPEFKIYIDGRTGILYPFEHAMRHQDALKSPSVFREEVERHDIDFSVTEALQTNAELMAKVGFELDFVDVSYALFRRQDGKFPSLGTLWARPNCYDPASAPRLKAELLRSQQILPNLAATRPLERIVSGYMESGDKARFLAAYETNTLASVASTRFYAYRALANGLFELALAQLNRLTLPAPKDKLAMVFAQWRSGDEQGANQSMSLYLGELREWKNVQLLDLAFLRALLDELGGPSRLDYLDPALYEELDDAVGDRFALGRNAELSAGDLCGILNQ